MDEQRINPGHTGIRSVLRVAGPLILICGLVFFAIGLISFFSAFGGSGLPNYFWCAFVGIPLTGVGGALTKFAYIGAVTRYMAAETAPVGKDTFNYLAKETKSGVRDVASAIAEGIHGSGKLCTQCATNNDDDATFCDQCGEPLVATMHCPICSSENDSKARFCDKCGTPLQPKQSR